MAIYTIIEEATGIVIKKVGRPDTVSLLSSVKKGQIYIEGYGVDAKTQLYIDGEVVDKVEVPATINKTTIDASTETATITNLPKLTRISIIYSDAIMNYRLEGSDTTFEFSLDEEGSYTIECMSPVYLNKVFNVEVI